MFDYGCGWFRVVCCFGCFFILPALQWAITEKNGGFDWGQIFLEKHQKFVGMLLYPQKFRTKQGFTLGISVKLSQLDPLNIPEPNTKTTGNSFFFLPPLEIPRLFKLTSGNLAFYFFDTLFKILLLSSIMVLILIILK